MIEINTAQGNNYFYSVRSNRIYPMKMNEEDCRNFHFVLDESYSFNKISIYTIEITQQCNLRCKYCCYSGDYNNRRSHSTMQMSYKMLTSCVNFIGKTMNNEDSPITVCFYGGEALLAIDKISWTINELQKHYPQTVFEYAISTNGVLLNKKTVEWICSIPNLKVTVTVDGRREIHDSNRVVKDGKGSFEQIMDNLQMFYQLAPKEYLSRIQFISTVESISQVIDLNDFWMNDTLLKQTRPKHISSIIPNFGKNERVMVNKERFDYFYRSAFNAFIRGEENVLTDELKRLVSVIERRLYYKEPQQQRFRTCFNNLYSCFITANGILYACERFCEELCIGSLYEGVDVGKCMHLNESFLQRKNKYCKNCWAHRMCRICATNLNNTEEQLCQYCENERMQLQLALQYYCEMLENKQINKRKL